MTDPFDKYQKTGLSYTGKEEVLVTSLDRAEPYPITQHVVGVEAPETDFQRELRELINRHSKENGSGTPDFILAEFIERMLGVFDATVQRRAQWRDEPIDKIFNVSYDDKVRITVYDEHGAKNEIGEAQLEVWPGETVVHGRITAVIPVFETPIKEHDDSAE